MTIKPGASIAKITMPMREAATAVEECFAAFGAECVVTSGDEPETIHRGHPVVGDTQDPHYLGKALDFRLWQVAFGARAALVSQIFGTLGDDFVVLWEIGPHTLRPRANDYWSVTCASGFTDLLPSPLPDNCARCGKSIQGATPHLHVQAGRIA
jgi:hypothetical protein